MYMGHITHHQKYPTHSQKNRMTRGGLTGEGRTTSKERCSLTCHCGAIRGRPMDFGCHVPLYKFGPLKPQDN